MLKHKKFFSLLLLLPVFSVFSCAKPKEPYPIKKDEEGAHLKVTTTLPETIESGKELNIDDLTVAFDSGSQMQWIGKGSKDYKQDNKFFLVSNNDYPTNTIITNLTVTTNVERNDLNFYVAYFNKNEETIYVSKKLKVIVTNANAIKPWVWYVVTGVVVFAVVGMIVFTRRYKAKKEGKL